MVIATGAIGEPGLDPLPSWRAASVPVEWRLALLAVALSAFVAVVQMAHGVLLVGPEASHDGAFVVEALAEFGRAGGWLLPRWSSLGNGGLGTPLFYFYPPGAYFAASAVAAVLPGLPTATILGVAALSFHVGAIVTCALWLRRHVGVRAALVGGALYTLMPYVAVFNPQVRYAFAEMAASAVLPLFFLAVDAGRTRFLRTALYLAPVTALMASVHLPSVVIAGSFATVYAALLGVSWPGRARQMLAAVCGTALGLGMAGATLIPAILLQHHVNAAAWRYPYLLPEHSFLLRSSVSAFSSRLTYLIHGALIVPLLVAGLGIPVVLRTRGWPRAALLTLVVAVLLTLPISAPVWAAPLPLRRVQFPWRLLSLVSLFGAALGTLGLVHAGRMVRQGVLLGCVALTAAWVAYCVLQYEKGRVSIDQRQGSIEQTQAALASTDAYLPEYFPAVGWSGWATALTPGIAGLKLHAAEVTGCAQHHGLRAEPMPSGDLRVDVSGCVGPTLLPQFYFPGWTAKGSTSEPAQDPETGLIALTIPEGQQDIVLQRHIVWEEQVGYLVAGVSVLAWVALSLWPARKPLVSGPAG